MMVLLRGGSGVRSGAVPSLRVLTGNRGTGIVTIAMGSGVLRHQVWFAYYFTPPALLAGRRVLKR
ncbi:MAG: hypothetical protein RMK01_06330 [Thermomicrobium sp.]|nr:hypothetical protein [Thermomicrobium sp.]